MLSLQRERLVYMFSAVLFTLTLSVLGDVIDGTEMRSQCGPALEEVRRSCADLAAGVEGCPAPASSPIWGLAGPKFTQVTSMVLFFLFLYLC